MLHEIFHGRDDFGVSILDKYSVDLTENGVLNFEVQALHIRNDVPGKGHRGRRLTLWRGGRSEFLVAKAEHPSNQVSFDYGAACLLFSQRPSEKRSLDRGVSIRPIRGGVNCGRGRPLLAHALLAEFFPLECFLLFEQLGPNDLIDLRLQNVLGQRQLLGSQFQIDPLLDCIRDDGNGTQDAVDHFRSLHRVVRRLAGQEFQLERHKILSLLFDVPFEHVGRNLFAVAVGIVTVREQHHIDVQPFGQQQVHSAKRRSDASSVPIKQNRDVLGVPANQLDLIYRQSRPARGDNVLDARLVQGHHIRVALNEQDPVFLGNRRFGQVHAEQHIALVVEDALGAVEVLGDLLLLAQRAAAKCDGSAREVPNGKHHPALEKVPELAVFILGQSQREEPFRCVSRFGRGPAHRIPAVWAIPDVKSFERLGAEPPALEVAQADGLSLLRIVQLLREPCLCPRIQSEQTFAFGARLLLLERHLLLLNLDAIPFGELLDGLRKAQLVQFHQKRHHAAALVTGKALENALFRQDVKGGCFLVGKRAQATQGATRLFEFHIIPNDLLNDGGLQHLVDNVSGNHDNVGEEPNVRSTAAIFLAKKKTSSRCAKSFSGLIEAEPKT